MFVNQRWREITGVTDPTPIPCDVLLEVVHPDDRDRVVGLYLDADRNAASRSRPRPRIVRPDGDRAPRPHPGAPVIADDGTLVGFTSAPARHHRPRRGRPTARDRSEQRYRNLMAKAPVGQVVYTLDGTLVEINQAGAALLGYEPRRAARRPGRRPSSSPTTGP